MAAARVRVGRKEEAGPSPIRALRVWAQDDIERRRQGAEGRVREANVLIQSGRVISTDMPDMPTIPAMCDTTLNGRHLLPCAIVAPRRRGSFGLGQP